MYEQMISPEQVSFFKTNGYLLLGSFYDLDLDIRPIQKSIAQIIQLIAEKNEIDICSGSDDIVTSRGFMQVIQHGRYYGSIIYDSIKSIPEFMQLVSHKSHSELFSSLRRDSFPGLASGGYGIRIDIPGEDLYRASWHQDFPAQLRSLDGLVFWSPLVDISQEIGPVQICPGSHLEGPIPVFEDDAGIGKIGAYALRLRNEQKLLDKYDVAEPLVKPGDLLIMDFLTLHQSGFNRSDSPRWSMQFRYFNYKDPVGLNINWQGSFADGNVYSDIIPSLKASD